MRDCNGRRPFCTGVTADPRLHGIARGLAELYEPQLRETTPESLAKLATVIDRRLRFQPPKGTT
ncbi:hypothetical protein J2X36_004088 [Methylobacterium sp. BE186]|nr:hypothetical protein [Methylobacterium sp. BE186]